MNALTRPTKSELHHQDEDDELDCTEPELSDSPYTAAEKAIYREYVDYLKGKGMCKIDDASSRETRLFNRFTNQPQSMSYIDNNFATWRRVNKKKCRTPKTSYITRTLPHVVGSQFVPNGKEFWQDPLTDYTYANTYRKYKPTSACTELSPLFMEFFIRLVPDDYERNILLQVLAHAFQKPHERPSWHLMLTSDAGTGKGFLFEKILDPLLHHTRIINNYSQLTGRFSTILKDSLFVLIDDAKAKSEATQTMLKSMLSEERVYVEPKYAHGEMAKTYTRFFLASNEEVPLAFDKDERRWVPLTRAFHAVSKEETQAHIKKLDDWLALPGSLDAVHHFFMTYRLEGFNPKCPPPTSTLSEMISKGKGIHGELLAGFIEDHPVFTTAEWMTEYDRQGLPRLRDTRKIPVLLLEAGYEKRRLTIHGEREPFCYPIGWSEAQVAAAYPAKTEPF
jgi:hypothetical protein